MKTAICVIIKDELDYLDEWLNYHLNIGIDEIYLFEDRGSLSHAEIVKPYEDRVHLYSIDVIFDPDFSDKYIIDDGSRRQPKLFEWFPLAYKDTIDWVLFNDIDEFLILKKPLKELLKEYNDKPAMYVHWKFYGANGHIKKPKGKVMDNFTKSCTTSFDYHWMLKSFVNLNKYTYWEKIIHKVKGGVYPMNECGNHMAYLNHYFTKSWEEWKWKLFSRGDTFPGNRKIKDFFHTNPDLLEIQDELLADLKKEYKEKKKGI